jgi:phage baseplate assembly protein W
MLQPYVIDGDMISADSGGFRNVSDLKTNIRQNLKMLVLTIPGEHPRDKRFGVGIPNYLFEMSDETVFAEIDSKIRTQIKKYMPFIQIQGVEFSRNDLFPNQIYIKLIYAIPRIGAIDQFVFSSSGA